MGLMTAGGNCAQAVLCAFGKELGMEEGTAMKLASGFGAGMGRSQEVCGALTGAVMALGLKHGSAAANDQEAKEAVYRLTGDVLARFRIEFGSCRCRDLLGVDLLTEEGRREYKETALAEKVCRPCVRAAVRMLEEIL